MKLSHLWRKIKSSPYENLSGYESWEEAAKVSTGYQALAAVNGTLRFREMTLGAWDPNDTLVDDTKQHLILLSALAFILSKPLQSSLKVLDFGGSFGMYYYFLKRSLPQITFDWTVVETAEIVAAHKTFEEPHLRWQTALPTEVEAKSYDLCLASGSLPYVAQPYERIETLAKLGRFLLITRTGFIQGSQDRVALQRVPPQIYDASYPIWLFAHDKFLQQLPRYGQVCLNWNSKQDAFRFEGEKVAYKSYLWETSSWNGSLVSS